MLDPQKTQISPYWARYGVSFVNICKIIDRVTTAPHVSEFCLCHCCVVPNMLYSTLLKWEWTPFLAHVIYVIFSIIKSQTITRQCNDILHLAGHSVAMTTQRPSFSHGICRAESDEITSCWRSYKLVKPGSAVAFRSALIYRGHNKLSPFSRHLKCVFFDANCSIYIKLSLKFVPQGQCNINVNTSYIHLL